MHGAFRNICILFLGLHRKASESIGKVSDGPSKYIIFEGSGRPGHRKASESIGKHLKKKRYLKRYGIVVVVNLFFIVA